MNFLSRAEVLIAQHAKAARQHPGAQSLWVKRIRLGSTLIHTVGVPGRVTEQVPEWERELSGLDDSWQYDTEGDYRHAGL